MKPLLSICILFSLLLLSCNRSPSPNHNEPNPGKIIIGEITWPGYIALDVAEEKKLFEQEGLEVEIRHYPSLEELHKDYIDGKLHGRANLVSEAIQEQMKGMDHRIVFAIDYSNGSDAIVASTDIQSPTDLVGKRVAFEKGTVTEFFLSYILQQFGHTLEEITPVQASAEECLRLLKKGEIDAAAIYEPYLSQILELEQHHIVFSSKEAPGLITDVLTLRKDFIDEYPKATLKLCRAYFRAVDFLHQKPEEAHSILAKQFNTPVEEIQAQLEGIQILDLRLNYTAFSVGSATNSIYSNARMIHEFISQSNNWEQLFKPNTIIDRSFLRQLLTESKDH